MRRIRVAEIVGNSEGGGASFVMNLIESLDLGRFAATLIAPEAAWLAERCAAAGVGYLPLPLMRSRSSRALRARLADYLRAVDADIIHAHGTRAAWYARGLASSGGRGAAFLYSEHLFSFDARRGLARLPWYAIERALCQRADAVLTSAPVNARRLLAMGWVTPERIGCDRVGFPTESVRRQLESPVPRARLGVEESAPLVGCVGRLVSQKGWPYLLRAFASVSARATQSCLIIVGDGDDRSALEAQARTLGIADRVRFVGAQTNPWSWLAHCDVIALPSLWEGGWQTPLEALAARFPLVVTRVGGVDDYVSDGETGVIVPPRDAPALAKAIGALLRDPARRDAMRAAPRDILAEFDVARTQETIAALYERLAWKRRGDSDAKVSANDRTLPGLAQADQEEGYPL
ncbi:MAG TPA: glycosyltransferase family 4 protein [Ktedonobacterales bacterium]